MMSSAADKTDAWRAELERRGLENLKLALSAAGAGRGSDVRGFAHQESGG
jgi:hypothetical protein